MKRFPYTVHLNVLSINTLVSDEIYLLIYSEGILKVTSHYTYTTYQCATIINGM
jgi:hypothetical protein